MKVRQRFGPGLLVAAAFVGPGTVTTASAAGGSFGMALLWIVLLSVIAAIVLQEMAARLGLATRSGLGEALRGSVNNPTLRALTLGLVVGAIGVGNAAYQAGNITGAAMGLSALTGWPQWIPAAMTGLIAAALLWTGAYRSIERVLIALVGVMGVVFLTAATMVRPDLAAIAKGLCTPSLPDGSWTIAIALIGTTVVPYNLFLHSSAVGRKWEESIPIEASLRASRVDTVVSMSLGGIVTLAIVVTSAAFIGRSTQVVSAADMASQLEPLLGQCAEAFFSIGLLAAGVTSAITAPLAASFATAGALGWSADLKAPKFRAVWIAVCTIGTTFAVAGERPISAIIFAQAANGLILPVLAVFLLYVMNQKRLLGKHTNGWIANALGIAVVLFAAGLGGYKVYKQF